MSLISKKPKLTEQDIEDLRKEISHFTQLEGDANSEPIKRLLKILDETRENTVNEFMFKEIEAFDSDAKLWFFIASVRAKLQVIDGIKKKYLNAAKEKGKLLEEFNKIVQ